MASATEVIFDELLYFVVNKMKTSAPNKILEICLKFYTIDEISVSRDKLWEKISEFPSLTSTRKVNRRGEKEAESKIDDMIKWLKTIDDAGEPLPPCASLDMTRIPLTSDGALTTSQIMSHHDNLRKEFVTIDSLKLCLDNLKADIVASLQINASAPASLRPTAVHPPPPSLAPSSLTPSSLTPSSLTPSSLPPSSLPPSSLSALPNPSLTPTAPTFSQVENTSQVAANPIANPSLASIVETSVPLQPNQSGQRRPKATPSGNRRERSQSRNRRSPTIYVGNKVTSGQMSFKGADLTVDRYVGRIDVNEDNVKVKAYIEDSGVELLDFQENSRTHSSFKSFKITARRSDLPTLEREDFWPTGVVFRNFFRPRQRRDDQATSSGAFTSINQDGQSN